MKIPFLICGLNSIAGALQPLVLSKGTYYELEFGVGRELQSAQIDTASSDIWVLSQSVADAMDHKSQPFEILYADGTFARGIYGQDTMVLGDLAVRDVPLAAAQDSSTNNVFGIGPVHAESCVRWMYYDGQIVPDYGTGCVPYENLPLVLRKQGLIESAIYSIRLEESGGILNFGAVDASCNHLTMLPIEHAVYKIFSDGTAINYSELTGPLVLLNQLRLGPKILYEGAYPLMLDTGSTVSSFPSALIAQLKDKHGTLTLNMRGFEMHVPVDRLHAVANDAETMIVLGQDALQGYQIVFDYESNEIGLGKCLGGVGEDLAEVDPWDPTNPRDPSPTLAHIVKVTNRVPFSERAPLFSKNYLYVDPRVPAAQQLWTWQAWI